MLDDAGDWPSRCALYNNFQSIILRLPPGHKSIVRDQRVTFHPFTCVLSPPGVVPLGTKKNPSLIPKTRAGQAANVETKEIRDCAPTKSQYRCSYF